MSDYEYKFIPTCIVSNTACFITVSLRNYSETDMAVQIEFIHSFIPHTS